MKDTMFSFLKEKNPKLCILSTCSEKKQPHSAVMGYAIKETGEIILSTNKHSKKIKNIKGNSSVALIFGCSFETPYIQCEGNADVIESGSEYKSLCNFFYSENPVAKKFKSVNTVFIKVKPSWVRCTKFFQNPPQIEEWNMV